MGQYHENYRYRTVWERHGIRDDEQARVRVLTRKIRDKEQEKGRWISLYDAFTEAAAIVRSNR